MCQFHSRPVLSLCEASRKYVEFSPSTLPLLTLQFHEKDLTLTPSLLQIRPILPPLGHILSKASAAFKQAITFAWRTKFQLVPSDMHHCNRAKRAIRTFKNHFIAILAGVDLTFRPYLWDLLLPQAELTLNLLRQLALNPKIPA
jgi:hypothetical protein